MLYPDIDTLIGPVPGFFGYGSSLSQKSCATSSPISRVPSLEKIASSSITSSSTSKSCRSIWSSIISISLMLRSGVLIFFLLSWAWTVLLDVTIQLRQIFSLALAFNEEFKRPNNGEERKFHVYIKLFSSSHASLCYSGHHCSFHMDPCN